MVVLGAGTAGAAAAWMCARHGMEVVVVDPSPQLAGARWVNAVPKWVYPRVGLPEPAPPEVRPHTGDFHLIAGWGPERVVLAQRDLLEVDMRHHGERLRRLGEARGVRIQRGRARSWDGTRLDTTAGSILAGAVVDASGIRGAGLVELPRLDKRHLCTASQEVRAVVDEEAAAAWCAHHGGRPGDTFCFSCVAGGFSILNVTVLAGEVSLLSGTMASEHWPSGPQLIQRFVRAQPWVGTKRFGGSAPIPVGGPRRQLVHGRVALLGDAAWQVYAAHGSGIATQLVAAHVLAGALRDEDLAAYPRRWWTREGRELTLSALVARVSRTLSPSDLASLIRAGVLTDALLLGGLEQREPTLSMREVVALAAALGRTGPLAVRLLREATRAWPLHDRDLSPRLRRPRVLRRRSPRSG